MVGLTKRLTEWFAGRNPGLRFRVDGTNANQGFANLLAGKTQIVQSTRKALDGEVSGLKTRQGAAFVEIPVASEFAVIAVHATNPVQALTLYELRMILSGQVKNWKQVGGKDMAIRLVGRDQTSEVRNLIDEEFMGDASFSDAIEALPTNTAVISAVANDPGALAFCDIDLHPKRGVKFLGIKASAAGEAIEPTGENIRTHRYTLIRTLYYYVAGTPTNDETRFLDWVLSQEGQLVVEAVGFYPLGSAAREEARVRLHHH